MNKSKFKAKEKKWLIKLENNESVNAAVNEISSSLGISTVIAKLLYQRGYTDPVSAKAFLYMETEVLTDPFSLKDMDLAVARIIGAVKNNEKITVYGDYDVDGVTSVCTLYLYLKSKGANIGYYIPNRMGDGYGVSNSAIDSFAKSGTKLIVTVDTGITANEEVEYAKTLGIDFVITDHHECRQQLPEAAAVVNPHRPDCESKFKDLAGVGVVFKLICALEEKFSSVSSAVAAMNVFENFADFVAIGTIADVMPIKGENRLIVSYGLSMIEKKPRMGISALIEASSGRNDSQRQYSRKKQVKITSNYIGYTLAPRINAAGRIRSATMAVELFLADNYQQAFKIAEDLCEANRERQAEENKIINEAYKAIEQRGFADMPVIVLEAENWHHGVIGIVSSRITEKYAKPSILVSFEGNSSDEKLPTDIGKGSGRSVKGLNLVDALCYCSDELVKFGGHELAAGLSVTRENLDVFRTKINEYAQKAFNGEDMMPTIEADIEIELSDITYDLAQELRILEPYGVSNPVPNFICRSVNVSEIIPVSEGKHTRLAIGNGKNFVAAMFFSVSPESLNLYVGDTIDIMFSIDINEWGGRNSVQLIVRDIKEAQSKRSCWLNEHDRFAEIWAGGKFSPEEKILPCRDDFSVIYRLIISCFRAGEDVLSIKDIIHKLGHYRDSFNIGYVKLKIILKVMQELNIIGIEELEDEVYKFNVTYKSGKTELDKSHLLRRLRSQQTN